MSDAAGFGHSAGTIASWRRRVAAVLEAGATTPCFILSPDPVRTALAGLMAQDFGRPARHWYSTKTLPCREMISWWLARGHPVEVVSALEFDLALAAGVDVPRLLVNGPAKHRWLAGRSRPGLRVHFDSPHEVAELLPVAVRDRWDVGIRLCPDAQRDPEAPAETDAFGMTGPEAAAAVALLRRAGLGIASVHLHLRSNIPGPDLPSTALLQAAQICSGLAIAPRFLDVGGGYPARHVLGRNGRRLDAGISPAAYARAIRSGLAAFPSVREVWLENGRFPLAGAGVLAIRVLDAKERTGARRLVCDGGRTLNALVSVWERHAVIPLRPRRGRTVPTAVHGPTCMAFDQIARQPLPSTVVPGDVLLWLEAGAYHIPWETRFSHATAEVWWVEDGRPAARIRAAG